MGRSSDVGATLLPDTRVSAISVTGSIATDNKVARACLSRMARFQIDRGGEKPFVVLDGADLGVAEGAAISSGFFSTGQRCTASSRIIMTKGIHDRFFTAIVEKMGSLKVGNARTAGVHIGPVTTCQSVAAKASVLARVNKAATALSSTPA